MTPYLLFLLVIAGLLLYARKTYYLTTDSLLQQFADVRPEIKTHSLGLPPLFIHGSVTGNSLKQIKVLDKSNKERVLRITNHTGIKLTTLDGKSQIFLFNTLLIKDGMITGKRSRLLKLDIEPVKLTDIAKMELQR
ncbi:hypothetical protein [Rurimicrobium arvi]|uniref:Uncharacterized protein n=1 Tax=Rurimicrobium arvi TaxID=2049916 RepID=A0ABP8MS13_9BACT